MEVKHMSTYVTNRAETMMKGSRYGSGDTQSQVRQRKQRIPVNQWIPCEITHCKEGVFTKNGDEMVIFTWMPLNGDREIETAIILEKPPYWEDTILDVLLPNATDNFKFADLLGKGAVIKVIFNGNYTNLVEIASLNEQEEALLEAKNNAAVAKEQQQHRDVEAFEEELEEPEAEKSNVSQRGGFGSGRSNRGRSNRVKAQVEKSDEFDDLSELESSEDDLDFDIDDEDDLDIDFDTDEALDFDEDEDEN